MPYTVWGAFDKFRKDNVDLDPSDTVKARSSRDYLVGQLKDLNSHDSDCPKITGHVPFGSFARKTKIRPLDDIDLLALIAGSGVAVESTWDQYVFKLKIIDRYAFLARFDDGSGYVSSTRLLNQIKKSLSKVKNYSKAEIKRTGEAIVLNLTSYTWVFDIVPSVPVVNYYNSTDYYLIPNGSGNWKRTDPRKDTEFVTRVNKQHNFNLLPTMRLLKYWNARPHKPRLSSYYFETVALKVFDNSTVIDSFPKAIRYFFNIGTVYIDGSCPDPKGLGQALDKDVDAETKRKVKAAMNEAYSAAGDALTYEAQDKQEVAINAWKKVFGPAFPSYGS
jgi:hypothetical protein